MSSVRAALPHRPGAALQQIAQGVIEQKSFGATLHCWMYPAIPWLSLHCSVCWLHTPLEALCHKQKNDQQLREIRGVVGHDLHQWRGGDLNSQPRAYESPALPLSYLAVSMRWCDGHYIQKVAGVNGRPARAWWGRCLCNLAAGLTRRAASGCFAHTQAVSWAAACRNRPVSGWPGKRRTNRPALARAIHSSACGRMAATSQP